MLGLGHEERGVDHAERLEDALGEELVERLARRHLDHPAEHVGGGAVVPLAAGLEEQRQPGQAVADAGEVDARAAIPTRSRRARYSSSTGWA